MQRSAGIERERRATAEHLGELNTQLTRLADLIGRESRDLSTLSTHQDELRGLLRQFAQQPARGVVHRGTCVPSCACCRARSAPRSVVRRAGKAD